MPGYGLPRSRRGALPWRWAADRLRRSHNYWLITTRPDGAPHAMPVWGLWLDDRFYFSTGPQSRKSRNLAGNPRCVVCNELAAAAVVVEGTAAEVTDPQVVQRLAGPYRRKYRPWTLDPDQGQIYEVRPRVVFGLDEKTFPRSTMRWTFEPDRGSKRRRE
jgi:nitroimidazol reductase NimA-like FMN-containing flavoprotein (pyridoxamine 5'-phosphate oxidase superfamily)